jgi:hypothetical protein
MLITTYDARTTPGRLLYRSRGWIKAASNLVLESCNAVGSDAK